MANSAYIKLVLASEKQTITLGEVKELLTYYQDITSKTGDQLSWHYGKAAFPYEITEKDGWFYLKAIDTENYNYIVFGVGQENVEDDKGNEREQMYIEVYLPTGATHGDKGKANELCKFIANKLKAQLHLFNGRVMYYYERK